MWRLWHKLFGWHYAAIQFGDEHEICRVDVDGDGHMYVRVQSAHVDLQENEVHEWHPLTFRRAKAEKPKRKAAAKKSASKKAALKKPA